MKVFLSSSQIDVEVLPIVRDIFRAVEKDNTDGSQRSKDSLEASLKILELVIMQNRIFNFEYEIKTRQF